MKNYLIFIAPFCFAICAGNVTAANQVSSTQWDRSSAMAAARSVNVDIAVYEISTVSSLSDGEATVKRLKQIEEFAQLLLSTC